MTRINAPIEMCGIHVDLSNIPDAIPWLWNEHDLSEWITSVHYVSATDDPFPVLTRAHVETNLDDCRFAFESTRFSKCASDGGNEWSFYTHFVRCEFTGPYMVCVIVCHAGAQIYKYDARLTHNILHRQARVHTAWKRLRQHVRLRAIVYYWLQLTSHLMACGGVLYERDLEAFRREYAHFTVVQSSED